MSGKMLMRECRIRIGKEYLFFDMELSVRKTLALSILPVDGRLMVKAPLGLPFGKIEAFIREKATWISKHQQKAREREAVLQPRVYADGAEHLLLGEPIVLRVRESLCDRIERSDGELTVYTRFETEEHVRKLVRRWYASQATLYFDPIVMEMTTKFIRKYRLGQPVFEYKFVKSYWGICRSATGLIRLNIELLRAPIECIEYVVMHELCHLVHPNHSQRFYALLTDEMPSWKERKILLNQTVSPRN